MSAMGPGRLAICGAATGARGRFCRTTTLRLCASVCARRRTMGGQWSGPKVARWIAARLGLAHVHAPRGWEALKKLRWSIQAPRPRNPKAAAAEEEFGF